MKPIETRRTFVKKFNALLDSGRSTEKPYTYREPLGENWYLSVDFQNETFSIDHFVGWNEVEAATINFQRDMSNTEKSEIINYLWTMWVTRGVQGE